jgi:hypothetical protein
MSNVTLGIGRTEREVFDIPFPSDVRRTRLDIGPNATLARSFQFTEVRLAPSYAPFIAPIT